MSVRNLQTKVKVSKTQRRIKCQPAVYKLVGETGPVTGPTSCHFGDGYVPMLVPSWYCPFMSDDTLGSRPCEDGWTSSVFPKGFLHRIVDSEVPIRL